MPKIPRVGLGTIQPGADVLPMVWALNGLFRRRGLELQVFLARASYDTRRVLSTAAGLPVRHLDSWLMSPASCRTSFMFGAEGADLSVVVGAFDGLPRSASAGGTLESLCRWLDLPRLAVIDVARLDPCRLPELPAGVGGLLLDRVDPSQLASIQTSLETLWGVPVLGALPSMPPKRGVPFDRASGCGPEPCLCAQLGRQLAATIQWRRLATFAGGRRLPISGPQFQCQAGNFGGLVVAMAYDEAFFGYFPDTIDLLELSGATVVDFSPLRDEALPEAADLVYIGGGVPHQFAKRLATNQCLLLDLREHVRRGGLVYGEAGGLAYLCSELRMPCGQTLPMAGVFPASAIRRPAPPAPKPAEVTLSRDHWLGDRGAKIRGYCDAGWHLQPTARLTGYVAEPGHGLDLVGRRNAFGSRLQVNFATQPEAMGRLCRPAGRPLSAV